MLSQVGILTISIHNLVASFEFLIGVNEQSLKKYILHFKKFMHDYENLFFDLDVAKHFPFTV